MSDLDEKLTAIAEFLKSHPKASVKVKFLFLDNYRHFPTDKVTNDSKCDSCDSCLFKGAADFTECDSVATVEPFLEWFKINSLMGSATVATVCDTDTVALDDIATAERQTTPPLGGRLAASDAPTVDWADLREKDFEFALQTITTVEELSGVANRRRVLNHDFKKWSEVQKSLILSRKFILENEK